MLKKLLHEPLVHFLLLGGLLFLFYAFANPNEEREDAVFISKERIEQLISDKEKELLAILTPEEKKKLIEREVYESILSKEALKIGLDINDAILKSHMAQKMEFVLYDGYKLPKPSDEVLKKFMLENVPDYSEEGKVSFTQTMMGTELDTFENEYVLSKFEVSRIFGRSFSEMLFKLEFDGKTHTLESDYGIHEVKLKAKPIAKIKVFNDIKEQVRENYLNVQREQRNKAIYEALKSKYSISVEEK